MGCATCSCSDMGKWLCTGACDPGIGENGTRYIIYTLIYFKILILIVEKEATAQKI